MGRYDVVVVGTRVAGAALAMLLARRGLRVLAVDRARFPSDTLSSHQVQVPGAALLARWGLLDALVAVGTPAVRSVRFDLDGILLEGALPAVGGADAVYSPRRTLLDALLVDAARHAGAEVREQVTMESLLALNGRVSGIRARTRRGRELSASASLVIGADGRRSTVARAVGARVLRGGPPVTFASYGYWSGTGVDAGEVALRDGLAVVAFPTNDELTVVLACRPLAEFGRYRRESAKGYLAALAAVDGLGERVLAGARVERLRTTPDLPHLTRLPSGPGWALAGDARMVMDPISGQGITVALHDAERLADAVAAALDGSRPVEQAVAAALRVRMRETAATFATTARLAKLRPLGRAERTVAAALARQPDAASAFAAAFTGVLPWGRVASPVGALRLLGPRQFAAALSSSVHATDRVD